MAAFQARERSTTKDDHAAVAKFWYRSFTTIFLESKTYNGDVLYLFADGYHAFNVLKWEDFGESLQASLRKMFLRTPEVALPLFKVISEHDFPVNQGFSTFVGELLTGKGHCSCCYSTLLCF